MPGAPSSVLAPSSKAQRKEMSQNGTSHVSPKWDLSGSAGVGLLVSAGGQPHRHGLLLGSCPVPGDRRANPGL